MKEKICLFFKVFCIATLFVVSASYGLFTKNAFADDKIVTDTPGACTVDILGVSEHDELLYTIATYNLLSYNCDPGTYLGIFGTDAYCTDCPIGSYCPGGTYTVEDEYLGKTECPEGSTTRDTKSTSESDCLQTILKCPENSIFKFEQTEQYCECNTGYSTTGFLDGETKITSDGTCEPISINITYKCNEIDEYIAMATIEYNQSATISGNICTMNTGDFIGWRVLDSDILLKEGEVLSWDALAAIDVQSITLIATYTSDTEFTVDYNCGDGAWKDVAPTAQSATYGNPFTLLPITCVKDGYIQVGWNTSADDKELEYKPGETITYNFLSNKTFTAKYATAYTITFDKQGGTGGTDYVIVGEGEYPPEIEIPSKEGYDFTGYYDNTNAVQYYNSSGTAVLDQTVNSDMTLYAQYTPQTYSFTYRCGAGSNINNVQHAGDIKYNHNFTTLNNICTPPTGYVFDKWAVSNSDDLLSPDEEITWTYTEDKTFTASYTPISYTVTYHSNFEPYTTSVETFVYDEKYHVKPYAQRTGWNFMGYATTPDGAVVYTNMQLMSNLTDIDGANIDLYAVWEPVTIYFEYDGNGGTRTEDYPITPISCSGDDTCFAPENPYKYPGYRFIGWKCIGHPFCDLGLFLEGTDLRTAIIETENNNVTIKMIAEWEPTEYYIRYDANGGEGTMAETYFTYGNDVTLSPNTFTRDGYEFIGWATYPSGPVEYSDGQVISGFEDTTILYAVWELAMCTVYGYTPTESITGLETVANMAANSGGAIYYDSSVSAYKFKDNGMELYDAGQEFTVQFTNGTLTGLAFCGVRGSYKLYNTMGSFKNYQTGRGCWCRYGVDHVNDSGWKWQRATDFSSVDVCRSECPMVCAQLVSEDLQFRANLLADSGSAEYDALLNGDCPSNDLVSKCDKKEGYAVVYDESTNECIYTPITYTVTYLANGGEGEMTVDMFTYDVTGILSPNTFTRTGYTFNGWATTADGEKTYDDMTEVLNWANTQDANIDLYALWTPITYTITYDANGGTGDMSPTTFIYGESVILSPNTFIRDGYEFNGWSTTTDGGVEYTDSQEISGLTGDITLYAVWAPVYTVTYDANGGTGDMSPTTFIYGESVILSPNTFIRDGYEFNGWSTTTDGGVEYTDSQEISGLTGDITLYAVWTELAVQTYTITYNANGGDGTMEPTIFNYGTDVTLSPNAFTRDGYEFIGWATSTKGEKVYTDAQTISGLANNLELYAVWLVTQCTVTGYAPTTTLTGLETIENITANSGGGIVKKSGVYYFETSEGVALYNQGQEFTVDFSNGSITGTALCGVNGGSAYNKAGHIMDKLNGWQAGKGCWCRYGTSTDEVYTVTLDDGSTKTYPWGRAYTAELASSIDACRAECPRVCAEKVATDSTFRQNLLLIDSECPPDNMISPCEPQEGYTASYDKDTDECNYTPITYTVTYNANGGEGDMSIDTFTYDITGILSPNTFTRTGYTFNGWAITADGEKVYNDEAEVLNWANTQDTNIDLYALWTPITYTVEYNANGGDGTMTPSIFTYDVSGNLRTNTFVRDGYEFIGWSMNSNVSDAEYSNGAVVLNWSNIDGTVITLYAVWQEKQVVPQGYTVVYSCGTAEGGTTPATTLVEYGTEFTPAANTCEKKCNTFIGWQISDTDIVTTSSFTWTYTTNKVLTAQWSEEECDEGGTATCEPGKCPANIVSPTTETVQATSSQQLYKDGVISAYNSTSAQIKNMAAYVEDQRWSVTFANSGKTINGFAICGPSGRATNTAGHTTSGTKYLLAKALTANQAYYGCYCKSGDNITDDTLYASLKQLKPSGTTTAAQKIDYCRAHCPYECANAVATDAVYRKAMLADSADSVCNCVEQPDSECCEPNPDNETFKIHMYTDVYTKIGETSVTYNQAISGLLTPEQANKVFVGWFDEGGVQYSNGDTYTKQTDTIVYARWEDAAVQYTVAYNANGGSGDMESSVFTYDIAGKLSPNTFTRTDYDFLGWARSSDATTPEYADQAEVYNWSDVNGDVINLYAVWKIRPATYTVTYHANGGEGDMAQSTFEIGVEYNLPLNTFTRTGHSFIHWATESDGSGTIYTDGQSIIDLTNVKNENIDLYAIWEPNTYTITYMSNGGPSADYSLNIMFGDNMPTVEQPTPMDGYVFLGYFLEPAGGTQYYDANGNPVSAYSVYNIDGDLTLYANYKAKVCEPTGTYSPTEVLTGLPTLSELETAGFLYYDSGSNAYKFKTGGMAEYNKSQRFTVEYSNGDNTTEIYGTAFCGVNGSGEKTKKYYKTDKLSLPQTGKGCWCRYGLSDEEVYTVNLEDGTTTTYPWERASTSTDADTCRTECPMICAELTATDSKFRDILLNGKTVDCSETVYECPENPGYTSVYNKDTGVCDYTPNTYTITLDPDGGETTQTSISIVYETDIPNAEIPTRTDYLFMGYFTDRNGSGDKFFDEFGTPVSQPYTLTSDITLYAHWKVPACTDYDGTVLTRCEEPILSAQEMVDNGMLEYKNTSVYKINDFDKYMYNQKWAVNFPTYGEGTGTISGSAFCGPVSKAEYGTKVKSIEEYGYNQSGSTIKQAHAGCYCQVGPTDTTKFWIAAGKYEEFETWAENTDACRTSCPDFCAQLVATDASFRAQLYGGEDSCPVGTNYQKACCEGEYETENGTYELCPDGAWCQNCQINQCDEEAKYTATQGANSPKACGTYLHVGDHKIFMRPNAKMTPLALHVNKRGTIFHANMSVENPNDGKEKHLKTMVDGIVYYIYDNVFI